MDAEHHGEYQNPKSISCTRLPDALVEKSAAKGFFGKFGTIKRFIFGPKRNECTVEYETIDAAQAALNYQGNFQISPTPWKAATPEPDFIDPDVQSELDIMQPIGIRSQAKQVIENYMRNPPAMMKSRMQVPPRFKAETLSVSVGDPRIVNAAKIELENLTKKPARTAEEKLQVLEARDKLYRLVNAKTTDISKATSTKGSCKDMCPEKERLMREARLQVASFEMTEHDRSAMDQRKSIKQYSRSAADAETPLPHDLRPEGSLRTAMIYLLHNIMNLCDDENTSIGDWFHFVWDRTRGIRKDITQQELCSPQTVELVEQCVRFHIHCAARLVAEDPSIFDQKINTENLTKCLQTLKYMYNDLKVKNITCPNEAEFRAYVVLLNLNDSGNFLWEIKELEKSILNSKEVRNALDVYFAIANHNYVKFFNLVRDSSYMSGCLMVRYFTQVRMKALSIIMRSYTARKGGFNFNISYITEILGFEDFESCLNFLSHHGLLCDADADIVLLDRTMLGAGETAYQMDRAYQLVESKMETSVAEAVCGGQLPSPDCFLKHIPHTSFDHNGFLKQESFYAEDQNGPSPNISRDGVFKVPRGSPPISPISRAYKSDQPDSVIENTFNKQPKNVFAQSKPSLPTKNIFKTNIQPDAKAANPFASKINFGAPQSQTTANSIFGSTNAASSFTFAKPSPQKEESPFSLPRLTPQLPAKSVFGGPSTFTSPPSSFGFQKPAVTSPGFSFKSVDEDAQELENKQREQEAAEKLRLEDERRAKMKADEEERLRLKLELEEALERKRQEIEELRQAEEKRKFEIIAERKRTTQKACEDFIDELIDDVVTETVKSEAQQSISLFVKMPEEFYEALEHDVAVDEIFKIYRQEFLSYVNQTKLKYETMFRCFKQWQKTTSQEIKRREKLSTIGCSILNKSLEQQAEGMHHPEQRAALSNMKQYLSGSPQPIVLPDFKKFLTINLHDDLKMKPLETTAKIFWKFLVSIPHKNEEKCLGFATFINKWLMKTFVDSSTEREAFHVSEKMLKHSRRKKGICIRKLQGAELLDEKGQKSPSIVQHSNGILFLTSAANLQTSRLRLQNILDKLELPVAVSIIMYKNQVSPSDEDDMRRYMDLSMESKVSSFEISLFYECHDKEKNLTQVVLDSCQFLNDSYVDCLTSKDAKLFDLQMQHILDFFQITIGDEMWRRVEYSCRESKKFSQHMSEFNSVIEVYNKCLDKLMLIVTNDFSKLPSLPEEFRERLAPLDARIPNGYEYFPYDWKSSQHQRQQISFIQELKMRKMPDDQFKSFEDFKRKFLAFVTANMSTHRDKVYQAVVAKLIDTLYRRNLVDEDEISEAICNFSWLNVISEVIVGKFNEVYERNQQIPSTVIYVKKELQRYKGVPWWYSLEFTSSDREDEPSKKKPKLAAPTTDEIAKLLMKSSTTLNKLSNKIESFKEVSTKTREVSKDFDQHLFTFEATFRDKLLAWEEKFKE